MPFTFSWQELYGELLPYYASDSEEEVKKFDWNGLYAA